MNEVINDINNLEYSKYRVWKPFMEKYGCQNICEIGVREGKNFDLLIEHGPEVAVAIDIWQDTGNMAQNDLGSSQERLDREYESFSKRMEDKPFVTIHREFSVDAAKLYPDNYFDYLYIDADHSYDGVKADLEAWYPKVRKGGFFFGDDYRRHKTRTGVRFGVVEAVTRFAHVNGLSFFVFPRSKWGMIK